MYYIRYDGYVGNAILWWAEKSRGYVTDIRLAGKYTKEKAVEICLSRSTEKAYLCSTIDGKIEAQKLIIDGQYIGREEMAFNENTLKNN